MGLNNFTDGDTLAAADLNEIDRRKVVDCTSGTRPSSPHEGMLIYETDTDRFMAYSGSAWVRTGLGTGSGARTGCNVQRLVSGQSFTNNVENEIDWDSETTDPDGFISTTSDTFTVPAGLGGVYAISVNIVWSAAPGARHFVAIYRTSDNSTWRANGGVSSEDSVTVSAVLALAAGDTVKIKAYQASGGTLTLTGRCEITRVSL